MKHSALLSAGALLSSPAFALLPGCGDTSRWKVIAYPRILRHNFRLFDGVTGRLGKNLMLHIENGLIADIDRTGDIFREEEILHYIETRGRTDLVTESRNQIASKLRQTLAESKGNTPKNESRPGTGAGPPGHERRQYLDLLIVLIP